jgi:outer membrane protein assembly factor BamB
VRIRHEFLAEGHVYLTTLDGTLSCFLQDDGQPLWREARNATSTPLVRDGQCYFSERRPASPGGLSEPTEQVSRRLSAPTAETFPFPGTLTSSPYRDYSRRQRRSHLDIQCEATDGTVGFGDHKGHSGMEQARLNLGKGHVSAVWAHQGPRPALQEGRLFSVVGDTLHCADPVTRENHWTRTLFDRPGQGELLDEALTPPAVINGKVFLATIVGEMICLSAATSERLWATHLGEPVLFQPVVARGRVYVGTNTGSLFCLETGDPADDGWLMWGAGPGHNGLPG